jgi:tRNA(His) 5'-end guanylyltransferase
MNWQELKQASLDDILAWAESQPWCRAMIGCTTCGPQETETLWSRSGEMKFDDLDAKMRVFETASDICVLPEMYMVARLHGRSFIRLTKEKQNFEAPFDERFRDLMVATTEQVMDCGFRIVFGYTQSDEISLLFHRDEQQFDRKLRKLNSVLAGEASAKFSLLLGDVACFDCRISQLPNVELVCDYFRWRSADAARNALNGHCYWLLRKQGLGEKAATEPNRAFGRQTSARPG